MGSAAFASDLPPRAAGLWILKSKDNPLADWSICLNEKRNGFIDTDVWSNFDNECEVTASDTHDSSGKIVSDCKLDEKTGAKLHVTFSGDFKKSYSFESVTEFIDATGRKNKLYAQAEGTFAGRCPSELKPGMKKMTKSGLILRP